MIMDEKKNGKKLKWIRFSMLTTTTTATKENKNQIKIPGQQKKMGQFLFFFSSLDEKINKHHVYFYMPYANSFPIRHSFLLHCHQAKKKK